MGGVSIEEIRYLNLTSAKSKDICGGWWLVVVSTSGSSQVSWVHF